MTSLAGAARRAGRADVRPMGASAEPYSTKIRRFWLRHEHVRRAVSFIKVVLDKLLHQLVAVNAADEGACVVVVGDICRVFGEQIADDLDRKSVV